MTSFTGPRARVRGAFLSALIFVVGTSVGAQRTADAPRVSAQLTLSDAVAEALVHNDRILNEHDTIEQADLAVRLARNGFRPKVVPNIQGSLGQTDVSNQSYRLDLSQRLKTGTEIRLGAGTSTAQIPASAPGRDDLRFYNADTTLAVTQPLLRGFGTGVAGWSVTNAELRRADAARRQILEQQEVALDVVTAYYRVVAQRALIEVARRSVERARSLRGAAEAKLDAGLVSQLDVIRAQQLVSQTELQLFDAQGAVEEANDQLAFLLGRDPTVRLDVLAQIPDPPADATDAEDAVATALARRLDLQSAVAARGNADAAVSVVRNQLRPQVDVSFSLTRRQTAESLRTSFGVDRFLFATFFTVSMPVDRTPQLVDYQNALIDKDRRAREIDTLRRRIADEARRAVREQNRVARNVAATDGAVSIAQKEVEVAQIRYDRGLSNNLDVITAETNLLAAESRRVVAKADAATAAWTLRAALGLFDPRRDIIGAGSAPNP